MKLTWIEWTMLIFPLVLFLVATFLDQYHQTKIDKNEEKIKNLEREFMDKHL